VYLHERVVKKYAAITGQDIPEIKMDLLHLLKLYPVKNAEMFEEVLSILPAQSPRIYTIASSPSAHSGEIHLTVEKDLFEVDGQKQTGLCSGFLSEKTTGTAVQFFVQKNKRFRLPDEQKMVILITPGTGVAAARSFLSERDLSGASGKNWLFFGEDHFVSGFLYQTEIQDWQQTGLLTNISLAFAKDQEAEVFVQDKIREQGAEFFHWLQSGAYVYVSGQKTPMSVEVEKAVLDVIETNGQMDRTAALEYFNRLKEEGRYHKDVY
jgi:sulfite reductase (NADPH) flavoprotein alpha-component